MMVSTAFLSISVLLVCSAFRVQHLSPFSRAVRDGCKIFSTTGGGIERASVVAIETTKLGPSPKLSKKTKSLTLKERTGYEYTENGIEYDVPQIATPKWFRVLVRKNSEGTLCELFSEQAATAYGGVFKGKVVDAFYPKSVIYKFAGKKATGGKSLSVTYKAMIPGLLFVKTTMNADIADDIEAVAGVRGFAKATDGIVIPLNAAEERELEALRAKPLPGLDEEMQKLRVGEYVTVTGGRHGGRYGIIEGTDLGKITVRLRSEYRDTQDVIEAQHLRHLEQPPEINYKNMTAKQAVEALLIKEPNGETLRFLRKEGLLNRILHPEWEDRRQTQSREAGYRYETVYERQGREGGRSVRTIANGAGVASPQLQTSTPRSVRAAAYDGDSDPLQDLIDAGDARPDARKASWATAAAGPRQDNSRKREEELSLEGFDSFEKYISALASRQGRSPPAMGPRKVLPASNLAVAKTPEVDVMNKVEGMSEGPTPAELLRGYSVPALRTMCEEKGLPATGRKAELILRLCSK